MTTQPDALRLADLIDWPSISYGQETAAELRRLHAELEQLKPLCYIDMASYALINSVKAASPNTPIKVVVHTQPFVSQKDNPLSECVPIYTSQLLRQPLTDEEIDELSRTMVKSNKSVNWLCRAIEAKLQDNK